MAKIALYIQCEILKMKPSWQMGRILGVGGSGEGNIGCARGTSFSRELFFFLMLCADTGIFLNIYDTAQMNFLNLNRKSLNLQYFIRI